MPKMAPGKQEGKNANVEYSLPIIYDLPEEKTSTEKEKESHLQIIALLCEHEYKSLRLSQNKKKSIICIFVTMGAIELRNSLIERFNRIIKDDSKLITLDGIFDSITVVESPSKVPEAHYKIVEERRRKHLSGETKGKSWDDVKSGVKRKYGF